MSVEPQLRWVEQDLSAMPDVRQLFLEYRTELGEDLCFQGFQDELDGLPHRYAYPDGAILLITIGGANVACGAYGRAEEGICEIKRMFVRPEFRGRGLGETLLCSLLDRAAAAGYRKARLDTLMRLAPAVNLYRRNGFVEVSPPYETEEEGVLFFEKSLAI